MAQPIWKGDGRPVAQVDTLTPGGTIEADDIFNVTLENRLGEKHTLSVAAGGTAAADVVDAIVAEYVVLKAAAIAPWDEVTVADAGNTATITGDTAGEPFRATETTTEANGDPADAQTFAVATTTAVKGPHIYQDPENWSTQLVPVADDDPIIPADATIDIYGVDDTSVALDDFEIENGCTINIGSHAWPLKITADETVTLGGIGNVYLYINTSNVINVVNAGKASSPGAYKLHLSGGTIDVLNVDPGAKCRVDVGDGTEGSGTFTVINHLSGDVIVRAGITCTTLKSNGGNLRNLSPAATVDVEGGSVFQKGLPSTKLNIKRGSAECHLTGTCPLVEIWEQGFLDCMKNLSARTFTQLKGHKGARLDDLEDTLTLTNGYQAIDCSPGELNFNLGRNYRWTASAI